MRVEVWAIGAEENAISQYRLRLPIRCLIEQGAEVNFAGPLCTWNDTRSERTPWVNVPPPGVELIGLAKLPQADVVVMQRPSLRLWADLIPDLHRHGIAVVVDVDDHYHAVNAQHIGKKLLSAKYRPDNNADHIDRACRLADAVTATTPALVDRYGYGHGVLLPNLVPERYLTLEPLWKHHMTVGWTGLVGSHPTDLQSTKGAVGAILKELGWKMHVVGDGVGVAAALRLDHQPTTTGYVPFAEYPERMAEIAVGIVPLDPSPFNDGKSALKMMEFAALGVPAVGSPTWDNKRMALHSVGQLAKNPGDWSRRLRALMESDDYREEIGQTGRAAMHEFTYERHCDRWWDAWTKATKRRAAA